MKDSLNKLLKVEGNSTPDPIDYINNLEQFYNSAWDKLIMTGGVVFLILGIVVPIISQFFQNRSLKLQAKEIKNEMNDELEKLKNELKNEIKNEFQEEIKKLEKIILDKTSALMGQSLHIQAISVLKEGYVAKATNDYLKAIYYYLLGGDYMNINIVNENLKRDCFPKISKEQLEDELFKEGVKKEDYIQKLKEIDIAGQAVKIISDLRYHLNKLK